MHIVSFRQAAHETAHGNDDRVYLIGTPSPYDMVNRITQLCLNTSEERIVAEIPKICRCGIVRIESMFKLNANASTHFYNSIHVGL